MRLIKKLIGIAVVLVVLVVIAAVLLVLNLGKVVKIGVEKGGSVVLDVPVTLDDASVSILKGSAGLDGLKLGSPEGFKAPEMFALGHASLSMDVWSVRKDEIVVHEVIVDGAEVTFELSGTKSNWGVLTDHLKKESSEEKEKGQKRVRIDRIVFRNGQVKVGGLPLDAEAGVELPEFEVTNLRTTAGEGLTPDQLLLRILAALNVQIAGSLKGTIVPGADLKRLESDAKDLLESTAGDILGDDTKKSIKDSLGGLLGGDDEEEE